MNQIVFDNSGDGSLESVIQLNAKQVAFELRLTESDAIVTNLLVAAWNYGNSEWVRNYEKWLVSCKQRINLQDDYKPQY